jgi:hypothetical protein
MKRPNFTHSQKKVQTVEKKTQSHQSRSQFEQKITQEKNQIQNSSTSHNPHKTSNHTKQTQSNIQNNTSYQSQIEKLFQSIHTTAEESDCDFTNVSLNSEMIFKNKEVNAIYGGEYWGTYDAKRNKFTPSMFFVQKYLHKGRFITVKDKQEWLFICGRDIFLDVPLQGLYVVKDKSKTILGYGNAKGKMLNNSLDIGSYLRREMTKK